MPEQDDLAVDRIEGRYHSTCVPVEVGKRTRVVAVTGQVDSDSGNAELAQARYHPIEAPRSMPRAVDQDNRCGHGRDSGARAAGPGGDRLVGWTPPTCSSS